MRLTGKRGIGFNKIARLVSILDMGVPLLWYLFDSPFTDTLRLVSYFLAVLVMLSYVMTDFFYFQELRNSINYHYVLTFCILSAVSCVVHFSWDLHLREIIRLALDFYVFYLIPTTWSDYEREDVVRFTFNIIYAMAAVVVSLLFLFFIVVLVHGSFSIAGSEYYISSENRLCIGLNPNTTGSLMLLAIIASVHKARVIKRISIDIVIVSAMAIVLLLLSQSRTAIISVVAFFPALFFFSMQIGSNRNIKRQIFLIGMVCLMAIALFLAFAVFIDKIYYLLSCIQSITIGSNPGSSSTSIIAKSSQRLSSFDSDFSGRTDIWMEAFHSIFKNPLFGCDYVAIKSSGGTLGHFTGNTHNLVLQIALYCGIPCTLIAIYIVVAYVIGFAKKKSKTIMDVLLFSTIVAISVEFMAESLILSPLSILYFASLGTGAYYNKHSGEKTDGNNILHNTSL